MIRNVLLLLMSVLMLGLIAASPACNASEVDSCVSLMVKTNDFTSGSHKVLVADLHRDSYDPKCVLLEASNENEPSDIPFFKASPIPTLSFCNHLTSIDGRIKIKLKIYGLLEKNMQPVHNVSLNILYQSLQINS